MKEANPLLRFENFRLNFIKESREVVIPDFCVDPRDFIIVSGPNGGGKSTFLNVLAQRSESYRDYCTPSGEARLLFWGPEDCGITPGQNVLETQIAKNSLFSRQTITVSQDDEGASEYAKTPFKRLMSPTLWTLDWFPLSSAEKRDYQKRAQEMAMAILPVIFPPKHGEAFSFQKLRFKPLRECSGGQRKMLQIFAAFIRIRLFKTPILILDEPLNDLDYLNKRIINNELFKIRSRQPLCVFLITHCFVIFGANKELFIDPKGNSKLTVLSEKTYPIQNCLISSDEQRETEWQEIRQTKLYPINYPDMNMIEDRKEE
jgi:energy-coupling factor transporter ATP-binding protein EcfA2